MLAGREREGYPKLLGDIDFDMNQPNVYGLITAQLSRPAGVVLAQGLFRPSEFLGEITADKPTVIKALGLRVVGSAVPGGPLAGGGVRPAAPGVIAGGDWAGGGPPMFTGASAFRRLHRMPVVGGGGAAALHHSSF